jgi:hypothetical protein
MFVASSRTWLAERGISVTVQLEGHRALSSEFAKDLQQSAFEKAARDDPHALRSAGWLRGCIRRDNCSRALERKRMHWPADGRRPGSWNGTERAGLPIELALS